MKNIASSAILTLAMGLFHSSGGANTLPAELRASLPAAELAGRAKLTVWGLEVYNASLWVAPGFKAGDYASHRFALELAYLRNLSGDAIAKRSISEMRRQAELGDSKEAAWTAHTAIHSARASSRGDTQAGGLDPLGPPAPKRPPAEGEAGWEGF